MSDYPDFTTLVSTATNPGITPTSGRVAISGAVQEVSGTGKGRTALTVYAPSTNADPVFVGFTDAVSSSTGDEVDAGYGRTIVAQAQVYCIGTSGDALTFLDT